MGFWTLFEVASIPILQVLIISGLGAFMATGYCNLLTADACRSLNKIVFMVFTPSLMFASLAKTVTLQDIISWWFMPVNVGITFLIGGILGWIVVKLIKPRPYLEGLVIATCSSGNLGNLLLIVVPAICNEEGSPFGERESCRTVGLSYASFSMALGGFFVWTYTYQLIRTSATKYTALQAADHEKEALKKEPNMDLEATPETHLLKAESEEEEEGEEEEELEAHQHFSTTAAIVVASTKSIEDVESQAIVPQDSNYDHGNGKASFGARLLGFLHQILEELLAPPTVAAILGFIFGATTFLRNLIIGTDAPLRVIQDSITLLGEGTIPCITLILGGNLTQGLRSSRIKPWIIVAVVCVRYVMLPVIGIFVVKAADHLGFLPSDSLYHFVLMIQFTLPPAMNIGTMTQLFNVGQEECSVLFLWTYLVAALALTFWSTVFMWILS